MPEAAFADPPNREFVLGLGGEVVDRGRCAAPTARPVTLSRVGELERPRCCRRSRIMSLSERTDAAAPRSTSPSTRTIADIAARRRTGPRSRTTVVEDRLEIVGELEITRRISLVAVCCSSASVRSWFRASSSLNRRTFSMAITAWSAKVWSRAICWSVNGSASSRRSWMTPGHLAFAQERNAQRRPMAALAGKGTAFRELLGLRLKIGNVHGPALERAAAADAPRHDGDLQDRSAGSAHGGRPRAARRLPAGRSTRRRRHRSGPRSWPRRPARAGSRLASC